MPNKKTNQHQPGRITNWIVATSLLKVCSVTAALALLILILAWILWGRLAGLSQQESVSTRATASLTTVGGLGGSVYLIVRYRAQDLAEKQHTMSRLDHDDELIDKALELLASDNPLKRVSGARQLIELADNHDDFAYQQRIIDAFCTFLRLSTSNHHGGSECNEIVFVEEIFINAMRNHLKDTGEQSSSWMKCSFDFKYVHFSSRVDLSECQFQGETDWRGVHFTKEAVFSGAVFKSSPLFSEACFQGEAKFDKCRFADTIDVDFSCSRFKDRICFADAYFGGTALFGHTRDENEDSDSNDVDPFPTTFFSEADFSGAKFCGDARFGLDEGKNEGEERASAPPLISRFEGPAYFEETEFQKGAYFGAVYFKKGAFFSERRRKRKKARTAERRSRAGGSPRRKKGAIFRGVAYFRDACFHTDNTNCLCFDSTKASRADFRGCKFDDRDAESEKTLPANIGFEEAHFHITPSFESAEVPCKKHRFPTSCPSWPKNVPLKEGEEGDIPKESYCPLC